MAGVVELWRCSVSVCNLLLLCCFGLLVVAFSSNHVARASSPSAEEETAPSFTCDQVRALFEGDFGAPKALHAQPEHESDQSLCWRRGDDDSDDHRQHHHHHQHRHRTCCSVVTEAQLAEVAEKRLKERVRTSNHGLKKHLTNHLTRYQDRIAQLMTEAQNRTAGLLTSLHKIPWVQHHAVLGDFMAALGRIVTGGEDAGGPSLEETVRDFFTDLFPPVFNFVLTVQGNEEGESPNAEYQACLKRYAEQIQPFGNQPDVILKKLRHSVRHAQVFQDSLHTFTGALGSTETVAMETSCRHALLRLQVCPGCRGVQTSQSMVRPCRGLCLNTMRGCLAKLSEISSSWDDLVVTFENVQVGMKGRHDLQKTLLYLDLNVSEAIMMSMRDNKRIYDEVGVKCRHLARDSRDPQQQAPAHAGHAAAARLQGSGDPAQPLPLVAEEGEAVHIRRRLQGFHIWSEDVRSLVRHLEDSRGLFNRLPDSLCQDPDTYDQDMQGSQCWNGSSVGRYMEQVPEVSLLSQVEHNKEVKISLLMDTDPRLFDVKDTLQHMRRNLSSVLNWEVMQGDGPVYKNVASGSDPEGADQEMGSGHFQPVIVDDEDLVAYGSGSGSGSGDGADDDGEERGKGEEGGVVVTKTEGPPRPTRPPTPTPSSFQRTTGSVVAVLLCTVCHRLLRPLLQ